jgi:glycosyltransferase involved in cell wall biosynthesis
MLSPPFVPLSAGNMTTPSVPLVSIVTPTYNSALYLDELLRSVEAQDYPRIEHIVIDDGSRDNGATVALLQRHPQVRWWTRENRGQYATLNEGFRAATGDFITTISADDCYADSGALGALVTFLTKHPEYDAAHGYTRHIDEHGNPAPLQPFQRYPYWMLRYNLGFIGHCSLLVKRQRLIEDGLLFDESLRFIGDADWLIRLYQAGYRFGRVERFIGAYRHHDEQVTRRATADVQADAARRLERSRVYRAYGARPFIIKLVDAYDTAQQRRVKVLGAWRRGGLTEVFSAWLKWARRKYGAQSK